MFTFFLFRFFLFISFFSFLSFRFLLFVSVFRFEFLSFSDGVFPSQGVFFIRFFIRSVSRSGTEVELLKSEQLSIKVTWFT